MQGKSTLNPFATPYVPILQIQSETRLEASEETTGPPGNNEATEKSLEPQLLESFYYDIQSFGKLDISGESSSKVDQHLDDTFSDELSQLVNSSAILECLASMFPDISLDYLADLLTINQGDFNDTIDALQQLESDVDGTEYPTEPTVAYDSYELAPQKGRSSGTSDST
ncbi:uncharacterized protein LOC122038307 [Zingiber officinale]|uniref:CUE domain-containing protein n=1 Tax=Zingiber officinale TaxID=94328 RepID=A0A8J5ITQ7_ZINOF|nr:uncharacterized protein LOC122038307 [Zingiber officinale]KAG6538418.1 hypothetical protein ZIOFF_003539 [Zingiber officinale]